MTPDDDPRLSGFHSYADGTPRDEDDGDAAPAGVTYWNAAPAYLADATPAPPASRRGPLLLAAGAATALGVAVLFGWTLMDRDDAPTTAAAPAATSGVQVVVTEPPPPPALPKTGRLEVLPARTAAAGTPSTPIPAPSPALPQVAADASASVGAPVAATAPPVLSVPASAPARPALRSAPAPQNGFDRCAEAPTAARRMVCGDMRVAAADQRMKEAYAAALDAGVPYRRLALDQDEWMEVRDDAAHVSRGAVLDVYRQRTRELWAMARGDY